MEMPNPLMGEGRPVYVIVEGRQPLYWACVASGHLPSVCPGKNSEPQPQPKNNKNNDEMQTKAHTSTKGVKKAGEWMEVVKKVSKGATTPQQQQYLKGHNKKP